MEIKFVCECGTTVQMPEIFAGKGCMCPACRKKMVAVEAQVGPARLEIPFIEDAVEDGERFETRRADEPFSAEDGIVHKRAGHLSRLIRSAGLLIAAALVVCLVLFLVMRHKGLDVQESVTKKGDSERAVEGIAPPGQTAPAVSVEGVAHLQEGHAVTPLAPQPEKEGTQIEPQLPEPTAKADPAPSPASPSIDEGTVPLNEHVTPNPATVNEKQGVLPEANRTEPTGTSDKKPEVDLVRQPEVKKEPSHGSPPAMGKFTLNLASFREKERADRYKDQLTHQGLDVFEWEISVPRQGKWYRVSVGSFPTHEQAVIFAGKLERTLRIKPIVAQSPKS